MDAQPFVLHLFLIGMLCAAAGWFWARVTARQGWSRGQTLLTVAVPIAFVHLFATTGSGDSPSGSAVVLYDCHIAVTNNPCPSPSEVTSDCIRLAVEKTPAGRACKLVRMGLLFPEYWRGWWVALWALASGIGMLIANRTNRAHATSRPHRNGERNALVSSLWLLTSLFTALAISGFATHERTVSHYIGENMSRRLDGCGTAWDLEYVDGNSVLRYWFAFLWEGCENAPLSIWVAAGLLLVVGTSTFIWGLFRRAQNTRSGLILVTQSVSAAAAAFCFASILARYGTIADELGAQRDSLSFLKLEWFSFLICVLALGVFSVICHRGFEQRLSWLVLLLGTLSTLRYFAEVGVRNAFYWPLTSLPALRHLSQDRWYLAAAALSVVLVYARSWAERTNWIPARAAAICAVLAAIAFGVAQSLAQDSWKVTPYEWQKHLVRTPALPRELFAHSRLQPGTEIRRDRPRSTGGGYRNPG